MQRNDHLSFYFLLKLDQFQCFRMVRTCGIAFRLGMIHALKVMPRTILIGKMCRLHFMRTLQTFLIHTLHAGQPQLRYAETMARNSTRFHFRRYKLFSIFSYKKSYLVKHFSKDGQSGLQFDHVSNEHNLYVCPCNVCVFDSAG